MNDDVFTAIGATLLIILGLLFLTVLGPLVGIVAGFAVTIVGLEGVIRTGLAAISLPIPPEVPLWVVGGALGFLGSFFKSTSGATVKKS